MLNANYFALGPFNRILGEISIKTALMPINKYAQINIDGRVYVFWYCP
ncbi:MAG: hypothetical protein WBM41_09320 [Arenicellales bacterium]